MSDPLDFASASAKKDLGPKTKQGGGWDGGPATVAPAAVLEPVARIVQGEPAVSPLRTGRARFDLDDLEGAKQVLATIKRGDKDHDEAASLLRQIDAKLQAVLSGKLGDLAVKPRLALKTEQMIWMNVDHRVGFLLSLIDGSQSYEDIIMLSGMGRAEAIEVLCRLHSEGAIAE